MQAAVVLHECSALHCAPCLSDKPNNLLQALKCSLLLAIAGQGFLCSPQVQHFFLERCEDGSWKSHWWLKAPSGGGGGTEQQIGGSQQLANFQASGCQPNGSRPSRKSMWSATTQLALGECLKVILHQNPRFASHSPQ